MAKKSPSQIVTDAAHLIHQAEKMLEPLNARLRKVLGENAFIFNQAGDGMVVVYEDGDSSCPRNACIGFIQDFDAFMKMNRRDMLEILYRAGV